MHIDLNHENTLENSSPVERDLEQLTQQIPQPQPQTQPIPTLQLKPIQQSNPINTSSQATPPLQYEQMESAHSQEEQKPKMPQKRKNALIIAAIVAALLLFAGLVFSCSYKTPPKSSNLNANTNNTENVEKNTAAAKDHRTIQIQRLEAAPPENDVVHVKLFAKLHNDSSSKWSGEETLWAVSENGDHVREIKIQIPDVPAHEDKDQVTEFDIQRGDFDRIAKIVAENGGSYELPAYNCTEEVRATIAAWGAAAAPPPAPEPVAPAADEWSHWDEGRAPNYVLEIGPAQVGNIPAAGTIIYGELDHLGRSTAAVGNITKALRDAGSANGHDDFGAGDDPSGWPARNWEADIMAPNGKNYHGYFWNRSHLIADSLGGQAIKRNAITGTRMQNVGANNGDDAGGMAYCEVRARKWLDGHPDGTLYYRAEPMYVGDELIPRAVIVDMKSSDNSIDKRVIVYNAAKGYDIDYSGNGSNVTPTAGSQPQAQPAAPAPQPEPAPAPAPAPEPEPVPAPVQDKSRSVIVTQKGKKYHFDPGCRGLNNAKSTEYISLGDAELRGLGPCSICAGG